MSFTELGLLPELLRALSDEGYTTPTPIQQKAIPVVLEGRDVLAAAQTGTGKTAAFTLPLLQRLQAGAPSNLPRVLVLTPTRELAAQVGESVQTYGRHLREIRTAIVFGGVGMHPQIDRFRRGVDIVVATPGRLLDHVGQRTVNLSNVQILVLDEADRMLDMGFIRDIRKVLAVLPKQRQNLLFSATFNPEIRGLAESLLRDPVSVDVAPRNTAAELVEQRVHPVDKSRKAALLSHLVKSGDWRQVLVFTRTKHGANRLAELLLRDGIETGVIHGNKSQNARTRALADFKANKSCVLVATDIAARGIDIDQLPHVVNYELPNVPEDYVHRIGRTGRAGVAGEAISLVCGDERDDLRGIQKLLRREIPSSIIAGFEPGSKPAASELREPAAGQGRNPGNAHTVQRPSGGNRDSRNAGRQGQHHPHSHNAGHGRRHGGGGKPNAKQGGRGSASR